MPTTKSAPFIIYNASAGSGKTHTLVQSFLYRLLSSPYPNQVQRLLAITFTNKAAQEMKHRILEKMACFATNLKEAEQDSMFVELVSRCNISSAELQQRAQKAYVFILHHFGQLHVSTIDKLTHQIIRTFARDFGLNTRFDVALDSKDFMAEVVERILSEAGEDKALTKTLIDYVLNKADELKSWDVTKDIFDIAQMFINENHMPSLVKLSQIPMDAFAALDKKILNQIDTIKNPFKEKATAILTFFEKLGLSEEMFPYKALPNVLHQLQQGKWGKDPLNKTLQKGIDRGIFLSAAAKKHQPKINPISDDIINVLERYKTYWRQVSLLELLRKNIAPLSLMQHIGQEVNTLQEERNSRLLGFFNKHIAESIKDTPTPFIYERMGVRFRHFFVDEFQDTSELQWSNLHPLFSHALEGEQQNGSLVLVGDAKQSIYRWRGGNPEQFMKLINKESPFTVRPKTKNLPINYRSCEEIVSFNNTFFKKAAQFLQHPSQRQLYEDSCNQLPNTKSGGFISISTIEGKNKEEQFDAYSKAVVDKINDCINQGYRKKDICVLVRKNEQGIQIANALTEVEIPITSSDSLLIGQSPAVQFLIHLVKLRIEPKSRTSQYATLERFALLQTDPHAWTQQQLKRPFDEVLKECTDNKFDFKVFQHLTLYAALEYAIWGFSLTDKLTAHLQAFMDEITKLQAKKEITTTQVLAHWEQQKGNWTIRPPENRDAVQIMTIHKAKGLAFPVVILPFSDTDLMSRNTNYAWYPLPQDAYAPFEEMLLPVRKRLNDMGEGAKQIYETHFSQSVMDTLNTLYVAMTRPIEELHIVTQEGNSDSAPSHLADIFSHIFPELANNALVFGVRKKPIITDEDRISTITPWNFNLAHTKYTTVKSFKKAEKVQFGLLFHEIMAQIKVPQDITSALSQSKAKELLSAEKHAELKKQINEVVTHNKLKAYFSSANSVYCERPLLTESGEIVRPDRFVVTKDKDVLLLDYKTGSYNKKHELQINEYANILQKSSLKIKQKVLVYVETPIVLIEV